MICISRRMRRSSRPESFRRSLPSKRTSPAVGSMSLKIVRPSVDLPQPDSPTMPSVSPSSTVKSTPSTARTSPLCDENSPPPTGKYFFRLWISSRLMSCARLRRGVLVTFRARPGEIARRPVPGLQFGELRLRSGADVARSRAAVAEAAAARQIERARHDAGNRREALLLRAAGARQRIQQSDGVGMQRTAENLARARALDDDAAVHDRDLVGALGDDA